MRCTLQACSQWHRIQHILQRVYVRLARHHYPPLYWLCQRMHSNFMQCLTSILKLPKKYTMGVLLVDAVAGAKTMARMKNVRLDGVFSSVLKATAAQAIIRQLFGGQIYELSSPWLGHQLSIFYRWFEQFAISAGTGARLARSHCTRKRIFHIPVYFAPRQKLCLRPLSYAMEYSSFVCQCLCRGNRKIAYRRVFVAPWTFTVSIGKCKLAPHHGPQL